MRRPPNADLALLAVALAAVSTSAPLVRESGAAGLVIACWRNAMASAVLVPTAAVAHRDEVAALDAHERRGVVVAGLLLAAHFGTWIPSITLTSVASAVALVSTQPVWAALLARAAGTVVTRQAWIGIAIALVGVVLLSGVDVSLDASALAGDALAIAGGFFAAAYVTFGEGVRRTVSTTVYTAGCYSVAAVALAVACVVSREDLVHQPAKAWWCILAITVGPQLLGHSVLNRLLKTTSAVTVSVALLLEVVGATALAWWWFGEAPAAGIYPAAALIAVGVVLVVRAGVDAAVPVVPIE
jgi:drug/metabolite transporter (DMT)-like permease